MFSLENVTKQLNISKEVTYKFEENKRHTLLQRLGLVIISAINKLLDRDIQNSGIVFVIHFTINYIGV
jgi:hypothetical protein